MNRELMASYLNWQMQTDGTEQVPREICEAFVRAISRDYIAQNAGRKIRAFADDIFRQELDETLRDLSRQKKKRIVGLFRVFLDQGGEAFVAKHRVTEGRWNRDVQAAVNHILRIEGVPHELRAALRREDDLYGELTDDVEGLMKAAYTKAAREYTIRSLRKAVSSNKNMKLALAVAESGFDFAGKYAREALLDYIPDDYADLYPAARTIERHFILHIGPTNSGKTYAALQAMHHAEDGIYLAPLRLLAYEQFDSMNKDGIYCSMVTGEERISVPGATVQSCTIEMMDERHRYDVAVIDEAQMVQDPFRGGHWTKAILGVWADEVHVCLAPEAEEIVIRMILQCRDTYEIVRHERFNELVPDAPANVHFPARVEDGDAYIVFSRSSVHACAAELQKHGINPSIIYGALPYDVRQNEARRFREGETNVVVATDAIGMGLNLPIRRVVFLETEKFDGFSRRELNATEYKQIAGRAGRFGQYEQGLYVSPFRMKNAMRAVNDPIPPVEYAHLQFPDTLLGVNAPLSSILKMWNNLPTGEGYRKADVSQEIELAELLENVTSDKQLVYSLVSMPFDAKRLPVFNLWQDLAYELARGKKPGIVKRIPDLDALRMATDLETLESSYREYDLLYYFAERFDPDLSERLTDERKTVSALLMKVLADSKLPPRTCRKCRRPLPWNSPYGICSSCAGVI